MTNDQKMEFAKLLFVRERLTQKEVAERVGVSEQTMSKWVRTNGWERLRRSLLTTKQEQIAMLYDQLDAINQAISQRKERVANNKEADVISKLTAAIRNMETDISIGEVVECGMKFGDYVRQNAAAMSKDIVTLYDGFIKSMITR
jgi:transcriptional regulator with XRE-family HTH domain